LFAGFHFLDQLFKLGECGFEIGQGGFFRHKASKRNEVLNASAGGRAASIHTASAANGLAFSGGTSGMSGGSALATSVPSLSILPAPTRTARQLRLAGNYGQFQGFRDFDDFRCFS
jgi:hypothetical protein